MEVKKRSDLEKMSIAKQVRQSMAADKMQLADACKKAGVATGTFYKYEQVLKDSQKKQKRLTKESRVLQPQLMSLHLPAEEDKTIILIGNSEQVAAALTHLAAIMRK